MTVVMSDDANTCRSDGASVVSSEICNPETILTSDETGYDVVSQSQATSAKVISMDNNSKKSRDLSCSSSDNKPGDPGPTPHTTGIKAPPVVKQRGRPRGHELTTIGLPAKKTKKESTKKPCSFTKVHVSKKEGGSLSY